MKKKNWKYNSKNFNTVDEVQKFIDDNNIQNWTDFNKRFPKKTQ